MTQPNYIDVRIHLLANEMLRVREMGLPPSSRVQSDEVRKRVIAKLNQNAEAISEGALLAAYAHITDYIKQTVIAIGGEE